MIAAIHQPNYLPWIGYFYKITNCDIFVLLDTVQYEKNGFVNRNKIKTSRGIEWLTIGVLTKGRYQQPINTVEINNDVSWSRIHEKTLSQNYNKTTYFKKYVKLFLEIYGRKWKGLADLNEALIRTICEILDITNVKLVRTSELDIPGEGTELLANICEAVRADTYLSGPSGKKYLSEGIFEQKGVGVKYSDFVHPIYDQQWGEFVPNMSIIDLLFNEGPRSLNIIKRSNYQSNYQ
jgi:hypothetical protein